jgi:hypothetical protein
MNQGSTFERNKAGFGSFGCAVGLLEILTLGYANSSGAFLSLDLPVTGMTKPLVLT